MERENLDFNIDPNAGADVNSEDPFLKASGNFTDEESEFNPLSGLDDMDGELRF